MTMRLLTKAPDLQTGQVIAARLAAEGIAAQVRSEALGPYPVSVGALALTEIWVPEADLERAEAILAEGPEVADGIGLDATAPDDEPMPAGPSTDPAVSVAIWVVAAAMLAYLAWRLLSIFA